MSVTLHYQIFNSTAPLLFGGFIGFTVFGHWRYFQGQRLLESEKTEERSTQFAIEPMMLAERDRVYIKQLKVSPTKI